MALGTWCSDVIKKLGLTPVDMDSKLCCFGQATTFLSLCFVCRMGCVGSFAVKIK